MNRLSKERSAYLKHAADQKIDWHPWSGEAFLLAEKENKPVFLSSGAVWCHWCHVMAKECFFDDEIAALLNDNFICIKLDRDERPDIDRRYQMALAAMGSGGGWPLSMFLTHDKKPFYGGTYFPPEDRLGRPGFKKVIEAVLELYKTRPDEISQYSDNLINTLRSSSPSQGELSESMLDDAVRDILSGFDAENGGFGTAPKFPMFGALEFLVSRYYLTESEAAGFAVRRTLEAMANGGFCDQIGGGFHRYSTDQSWIIPHFEKMADDNAWLLRNYVNAYSVFGDEIFREVARGTIRFINNVLSDPEGGFYVSQDADVTPDDEGGYFTWTDDDFRRTLDADEYRILSLHFLHDSGAMHHDKSKKVLFRVMSEEEIAKETGSGVKEVAELIKRGKSKLLQARNKRQEPFIDKTLYTSINGMLVSAYLLSYRALKDTGLKEFALKSLDRIMKMHLDGERLFHAEGVKAFLDDYLYLADALIAAYEVTGSSPYLQDADKVMGMCIKELWDENEGGFNDADDLVLGIKVKGIEDIPHPSGNSLGIGLLLKLSFMTKKDEYLKYAERSLKVFSERAKEIGIHAGYYFYCLDTFFNSLKLSIHTPPLSGLSETAVSFVRPNIHIFYGEDKGCVIPCFRDTCSAPVTEAVVLERFLREKMFMKKPNA